MLCFWANLYAVRPINTEDQGTAEENSLSVETAYSFDREEKTLSLAVIYGLSGTYELEAGHSHLFYRQFNGLLHSYYFSLKKDFKVLTLKTSFNRYVKDKSNSFSFLISKDFALSESISIISDAGFETFKEKNDSSFYGIALQKDFEKLDAYLEFFSESMSKDFFKFTNENTSLLFGLALNLSERINPDFSIEIPFERGKRQNLVYSLGATLNF